MYDSMRTGVEEEITFSKAIDKLAEVDHQIRSILFSVDVNGCFWSRPCEN
jgi:hypothetical protein